jgi:hypothetical protein
LLIPPYNEYPNKKFIKNNLVNTSLKKKEKDWLKG